MRKVYEVVAPGLVPVEMQRPTDALLTPPSAETNPHACLAEGLAGRPFRVPCFLVCEGPDFDPAWGRFRRMLVQNAREGHPPSHEIFEEAAGDAQSHHSAALSGLNMFFWCVTAPVSPSWCVMALVSKSLRVLALPR